jgi:hypothetical protein
MPRRACSAFESEALVAADIDANHRQRDADSLAGPSAVRCPLAGIDVQAVIDMDGAQAAAPRVVRCRQQVQQDRRIETTAVTDQQRSAASLVEDA